MTTTLLEQQRAESSERPRPRGYHSGDLEDASGGGDPRWTAAAATLTELSASAPPASSLVAVEKATQLLGRAYCYWA